MLSTRRCVGVLFSEGTGFDTLLIESEDRSCKVENCCEISKGPLVATGPIMLGAGELELAAC